KRMAEAFRIRIEMRQIGMRQEASRLGGIGSCGRELCCSTWLTDFKTVSTAAARYQNLSLNTLKLAGQCGKLKCCLNYELDSYMDALKDIPTNVDRLDTNAGTAFLQKTDIFKKVMWYSYPGAESWIPLEVNEVRKYAQMNKEGLKSQDLTVHSKPEEEIEKPISYDYENVVGQDSLTRLDEKNKKRRKKKPRNKKEVGMVNKPAEAKKAEKKESGATPPKGEPNNENKPKKRINRNRNKNRNRTPKNNKSDQ